MSEPTTSTLTRDPCHPFYFFIFYEWRARRHSFPYNIDWPIFRVKICLSISVSMVQWNRTMGDECLTSFAIYLRSRTMPTRHTKRSKINMNENKCLKQEARGTEYRGTTCIGWDAIVLDELIAFGWAHSQSLCAGTFWITTGLPSASTLLPWRHCRPSFPSHKNSPRSDRTHVYFYPCPRHQI